MNTFKKSALKIAITSALLTGANFNLAAAEEASASEVERIQVTGSRIKRTDMEAASPVVTLTSVEMESRGFSSVQDVLDSLAQNTGGSMTGQSVHGFTPAASGVNLRGAGMGRSLTLIDGKRLMKYPKAAGGTDNFIDTANLPLAAVERIDVLTTGASAIYGSDAMGGVINIILKKDYDGVGLKLRTGDTFEGGRGQDNVALTVGSSSDKGNITFMIEYDQKEQLKATDRENFGIHTDLAFGDHPYNSYSSYGARIAGPGGYSLPEEECTAQGYKYWDNAPICGFDRSAWRDLLPEQDRLSTMVNYHYELNDNHEFYGRTDFTSSGSVTNIEPMAINDYKFQVDGNNLIVTVDPSLTAFNDLSTTFDKQTAFNGDFADLGDGNYEYRRRLKEYGNRITDASTKVFYSVFGLRGDVTDDIGYDFSYAFGRSELMTFNRGYASVGDFYNVLTADNGHSLLQPLSSSQVAESKYTGWSEAQSNISQFQFNLNGTAFELPAGDISWAAGVESTREWFFDFSDEERQRRGVLSTGGASGEGARDYWAVYGEVLVPVFESFSVTLAGRHDDFSDFGSHFSPQISAEYRPMEELLIRALWASTFRAPDMQRVYGDTSTGFSQITDPQGCTASGGTIDPNSPIPACNGELYITSLSGPNANLDPETGENWNVGFVYSGDNWSVTMDVWEVTIDDIVDTLTSQDIANSPDLYGNLITRDNTGVITFINQTAQNLANQTTAGVDTSFTYNFDMGNVGELRFKGDVSYLSKYDEQTTSEDPVIDNIEDASIPEWRSTASVGYNIDDFSTTLSVRYVGEMNGTNVEFFRDDASFEYPLTIDSLTTINWTASYNLPYYNSVIKVGVNNLTDEGPNADYTDTGWPHYPRSYHFPNGREWFMGLEAQF